MVRTLNITGMKRSKKDPLKVKGQQSNRNQEDSDSEELQESSSDTPDMPSQKKVGVR